jgi:hypothetical protein
MASLVYKYYSFGESKKNLVIRTPTGYKFMKEPKSINHDISLGIGLAYNFL